MRDGNRSSIFDEVRKTLARAEAAIHAAETARDKATRTVQRACEIQQRGARRRSA